jgi:iron complex transport system ATP-binding protein
MSLHARRLVVEYGERRVVGGLDLALPTGGATVLVGPNGSGKSTILKALARLLRPSDGAVVLDGRSIHETPTREVARRLGFLPQRADAPEGLTVRELVAHGRFPHRAAFGGPGRADVAAVERAIDVVSLRALADRPVDGLSGGERQRAWIAMALAQETAWLLLDEPTTFLDLRHQIEVLELVRRLHTEEGKTVVMVLHDLNLAARYAGRMIAIGGGGVLADGTPEEVMRPDLLRAVFGVDALVIRDPRHGTPLCVAGALAPSGPP